MNDLKKLTKSYIKKYNWSFTKYWVDIILTCSCIWITLSYILAFLGKENIAESLSATVATVIVGTVVPYFIKSFLETYNEEKNKIKIKELEQQDPLNQPVEDFNSEEL